MNKPHRHQEDKTLRARFNEAKIETLELVNHYGRLTSTELSRLADITLHNASTRLKRYYRQGSLYRDRLGRAYVYYMSPAGVEKLLYFQSLPKCRPVYRSLLSIYSGLRCKLPQRDTTLDGGNVLSGEYISQVVDQAIYELFSVPDLSVEPHENTIYDDTYVELDEAVIQSRLSFAQRNRQRVNPPDEEDKVPR